MFVIIALMGISCNNDVDVNALQEGDIVFIESQSSIFDGIKSYDFLLAGAKIRHDTRYESREM